MTGEAKELHSKDQHCDGMAKKYKVTNSKGMAWIGKAKERQRSAREQRRLVGHNSAKEKRG